ncbi:MAG: PSD1 and planctomycete cytochrome C domain-containing protein [Planctomycetota bacterium]
MGRASLLVSSLTIGLSLFNFEPSGFAQDVDFQRDVMPILSAKCFDCHGPDGKHRKAKLRLDTEEGLFQKRKGGSVVQAGDASSLLLQRVTSKDPSERMPPADSKKTLSPAEIAILKSWVEQGASWSSHWAFVPPKRPELPKVENSAWVRNAIDPFVLARLEAAGLEPNDAADRRTLARRVYLDLTGLPPAIEQVDAFLSDDRPDAYERLVEAAMSSPRYGERMTLAWMDAARYGDSSVYHADGPRFMWPWRDWVIRSYNEGLPFDRFTVQQLAGDLLPNSSVEDKVASGFHRNHGTTDEGGAIDEEYRVLYIVDRVSTTATVWLGLTMECAQCHDHKYDPISQREFYQFYAYFNRAKDRGMQTRNGNAPPFVQVVDPMRKLDVEINERKLNAVRKRRAAANPKREEFVAWRDKLSQGDFTAPSFGAWSAIGPFSAGGKTFDKSFGVEPIPKLDKKVKGKSWKPFELKDGEGKALNLGTNNAMYFARTVTSESEQSAEFLFGSDDGIRVWLDGKEVHKNNAGRGLTVDQDRVKVRLRKGEQMLLVKIVNQAGPSGIAFRSKRAGPPAEIVKLIKEKPSEANDTKLFAYFRENEWSGLAAFDKEIQGIEGTIKQLKSKSPTSMILEDQEKPRMTYILSRGNYDSPLKDQPVEPGVPAALPALPKDAPRNRLGLAKWIVDPKHPLTARVAVNRYWQLFFGRGIITSMGDFGTRGEAPSHPKLLDYLASDFVDSAWDVKRMIRQILLSATYRQSARVSDDKLEKDPSNALVSRGPRFRLQGEFVRDQALAVSGLLVGKIGGPSAKPYQPPRIWNEVSLNGGLRYQRDKGSKLYRRGMYTYWKRSAPLPSLRAFDAPTREKCVIARQITNTPLQALVTLNDVQFVEAARLFAERVMRESPKSDFHSRVDYAFLIATSRKGDDVRHRTLQRLYDSQLDVFKKDTKRAEALLAFGEYPRDKTRDAAELAAWTLVASVILNLDEVLTKE